MRVLGIGVNLELFRHRLAEFRLRQHAPDGELDNSLRALGNHLFRGGRSQTSWIASVMTIKLLLNLVSLQDRFGGIDHNDVIAHIHKRRPFRATLARQNRSNLRGQMPDGLTARIYHVPFSSSSEFLSAGEVSRHS